MIGTGAKLLGGTAIGATVAALRVGRSAGALPSEVAAVLPGDGLLAGATTVSTQAIRLPAGPQDVWPWLVQMGYGRGGWYAIDRLERWIGAGDFLTGGSAERIVPELQQLAVGDRVPMSDRLYLSVARLEPPHVLVLVLPPGGLGWVWTFVLRPMWRAGDDRTGPPTGTRLLVRTRMAAHTPWLRAVVPLLDVGHLVMQSVQRRRIRDRVDAAVSSARDRR